MENKTVTGKITFIHHDKQYATIEYTLNGKKKTITGSIAEKDQQKLKDQKIIKKIHHYNIGDEVSFIITLSMRGDKMIADCMQFLFNNELDNILQKATIENRLVGYLKKVDDDYFVKETSSYILFPLVLSAWERKPKEDALNEPIFFKLNNIEKGAKSTASLFRSEYIPEFLHAMNSFNKKEPVNATIYNITPHAIYIHLVGNKIEAKIALAKEDDDKTPVAELKIGDVIKVKITFISGLKIVVERV
ncbi:MAG: S1 RNA-binding domain-containing protein [Sphingobacteriales bacterium]|nr:S1 RNA-binding domain-containing protein [Sphingobacteriales bacterium]